MSVKPHFESYRYTKELNKINGQSIVECRISGSEIGNILAVYAKAVPSECICTDGEVRYNGKLILSIVYEDTSHTICRAERGAEFSHKCQGEDITPSCTARAVLTTDNINTRREGTGLYISVIVGAKISVFGVEQIEYLLDGENLICNTKDEEILNTISVFGEIQNEDEFDTDFIRDILIHTETASVKQVILEDGNIIINGEINLNICAMKEDSSLSVYERLLPFKMQIPSEECKDNMIGEALVNVKSAIFTVGADENKGKCKILAELILSAECKLYSREKITVVDDLYSKFCDVKHKKEKIISRYPVDTLIFTEHASGNAILNGISEGTLEAAIMPSAEIECKNSENGKEAEGAVFANLIFAGENSYTSADMTLPFVFPLNYDDELEAEGEVVVCGLSIRRHKDGTIEGEATLKVTIKLYKVMETEYINDVELGDEYSEENAAISIFIPEKGYEKWEMAKRLKVSPEELERDNPEMKYPLKGNERIFVYRQKV